MGWISDLKGRELGLQIIVKGTIADPTAAGLAVATIADQDSKTKQYKTFFIKIDSAGAGSGTTGALKVKNAHGTTLTLNFNVQDEWYPEPLTEIVQDAGNAVTDIVYGVAF